MVKLKLEYQAELENVTDLEPTQEVYYLDLQCTSCREKHPHPVSIDAAVHSCHALCFDKSREMTGVQEERSMSGSRGSAHLVWKCSFCKRESSASFDTSFKRKPYDADAASSHAFATAAVLECRGCEVVDWHPYRTTWRCKGAESNTPFEIDELEDWTDYDEKAGGGASIMEVKTRVSRA